MVIFFSVDVDQFLHDGLVMPDYPNDDGVAVGHLGDNLDLDLDLITAGHGGPGGVRIVDGNREVIQGQTVDLVRTPVLHCAPEDGANTRTEEVKFSGHLQCDDSITSSVKIHFRISNVAVVTEKDASNVWGILVEVSTEHLRQVFLDGNLIQGTEDDCDALGEGLKLKN